MGSTNLKPELSGLAIWSVVFGILSVPPFPFGFLAGIPAIILGNKALAGIKETGDRGRGLAITGITLGYFSIVLSVVVIVLIVGGVIRP